ncbi:MAG: GFA family protein [Burkholderiales bacterium]|nr:GFA family protein [Burkholderiales bacterium]
MDAGTPTTRGSCLCGSVHFAVGLPTRWVAHCHCTRCQRAHGAAFVTWVGADAAKSQVDDPRGVLRWYDSGTGASRGFCGSCGSPMFFKSPQWAGELHIARALFTEPVDREPQMHGYYDTHVGWFQVADGLPTKPAP